jgi:hypothetical protein
MSVYETVRRLIPYRCGTAACVGDPGSDLEPQLSGGVALK